MHCRSARRCGPASAARAAATSSTIHVRQPSVRDQRAAGDPHVAHLVARGGDRRSGRPDRRPAGCAAAPGRCSTGPPTCRHERADDVAQAEARAPLSVAACSQSCASIGGDPFGAHAAWRAAQRVRISSSMLRSLLLAAPSVPSATLMPRAANARHRRRRRCRASGWIAGNATTLMPPRAARSRSASSAVHHVHGGEQRREQAQPFEPRHRAFAVADDLGRAFR